MTRLSLALSLSIVSMEGMKPAIAKIAELESAIKLAGHLFSEQISDQHSIGSSRPWSQRWNY